MTYRSSILMVSLLALSPFSHAAEVSIDQITESVRRVCLVPGDAGKEWAIKAAADGAVKVNFKIAGEGKIEGNAGFTRSEWEGVQRVLKEKQADENARYRQCAEKLTPIFLDKYVSTSPNVKTTPSTQAPKVNAESAGRGQRLPVTATLSGRYVTLITGFKVEVVSISTYEGHTMARLRTEENGDVTVEKSMPIDVSFKGQNYKLSLSLAPNEKQYLLTLSSK